MRRGWTICLAWTVSAGAAWAQMHPISPEARALMQKAEDIRRTVRDPLREQMAQRREALEKEADLNILRTALENAQKAYETRTTTDPAIVEADKAAEALEKALPETIQARLANHPRLQAIQKDLDDLQAARSEMEKQRDEFRKQLNEVRQELEQSADLKAYREAYSAAEQAYYGLPRTDPKFVAARQAMDAAQKALSDRIRDLPEKKALDDAQRAYQELTRNSPELAQARQARDQAREAYEQRAEQLIRAHPKGAALQRQIDELEQRQMEVQAQREAISQELYETRRDVDRNDPAVVQAREACEQARKRHKELIGERAAAERKALDDARQALDRRLREKVAEDVVMKDLQDRLNKAEKQIMELTRQQYELRKKQRDDGGGEGGEGRRNEGN